MNTVILKFKQPLVKQALMSQLKGSYYIIQYFLKFKKKDISVLKVGHNI